MQFLIICNKKNEKHPMKAAEKKKLQRDTQKERDPDFSG